MKDGTVCYIEFFTSSLEKSRLFYERVFGWRFSTEPGLEGVLLFSTPEGIGGLFKKKPGGIGPTGPIVHVKTADIEETLRRVTRAGGRVILPRTPKSGTKVQAGFFALIEDDVGNRVGLST
jgi:predicted enzyme related to lactoylglutathione lyase